MNKKYDKIKENRQLEFNANAHRHYGLTGKTILVKWRNAPDSIWDNVWLPVKIVREYPRFLCGIVQPHKNPKGQSVSKPYPLTMNKIAIMFREYILRGIN